MRDRINLTIFIILTFITQFSFAGSKECDADVANWQEQFLAPQKFTGKFGGDPHYNRCQNIEIIYKESSYMPYKICFGLDRYTLEVPNCFQLSTCRYKNSFIIPQVTQEPTLSEDRRTYKSMNRLMSGGNANYRPKNEVVIKVDGAGEIESIDVTYWLTSHEVLYNGPDDQFSCSRIAK